MSGTCALVVPWHVSGFGYATDTGIYSGTCISLIRNFLGQLVQWGSDNQGCTVYIYGLKLTIRH